ncbi:Mitogen-Activated Protein Kinase Kinase Kinase 8 [Paramecium bursaria]
MNNLKEYIQTLKDSTIKGQNNLYKIENEIAMGTGGIVFKGKELEKLQRDVAIKFQLFMHENEIMCTQNMMINNFKHVINVYDFFRDFKYKGYFVIMELGDQHNLTRLYSSKKFNDNEILDHFQQICLGVMEVHQRKWIHRDIKPDNIIQGQDQILRLCDLGLLREVDENINQPLTRNIGTPLLMAPELLDALQPYNKKVDIWALGCTLYWMLTNSYLFSKNSIQEIFEEIKAIKQEEIDIIIQSLNCKDYFKLILLNCLKKDANQRATTNHILQYIDTIKQPKQNVIPPKPNLQNQLENNKKILAGTQEILLSKHLQFVEDQIQLLKKSLSFIIQNDQIDIAIQKIKTNLNSYFQQLVLETISIQEHQFRIDIGKIQQSQQKKLVLSGMIQDQKNVQFQKRFQSNFPIQNINIQQVQEYNIKPMANIKIVPKLEPLTQFQKELQNQNIKQPRDNEKVFEFLYEKIIQLQYQIEQQNQKNK